LATQFSDFSMPGTASITAWSWNFGDGGASTQPNPGHTYTVSGVYTVSLTVTSSVGADTETKADCITVDAVPSGPTADFSATSRTGAAPLPVQFTDASAAGSAAVTSWSWNFGDGGTSTQQNPSYNYVNPGTYDVSLAVTTSVGSDTETKTGYITAEAPLPIPLQLEKWALVTGAPTYVNMLFQALGSAGIGVTDLGVEDFSVLENSQPVSPAESTIEIRKQDRLPYTFYTVLMLDNSASIGPNLDSIRTAARTLVNGMGAKQQIAVYSFSDSVVPVIEFTGFNGKQAILDAIDAIPLGSPSTDLYGAAIQGAQQWTDQYELSEIAQGALVLLTDGSDTAASSTLEQALSVRSSKRCYTIGLGPEVNASALQSLGNAGYHRLADATQLAAAFAQIQADIDAYVNSFYLLRYSSPKRGADDHSLVLHSVLPYQSNVLTGYFNSGSFYSVMPGVWINDDYSNPDGISQLAMNPGPGQRVTLQAHSYFGTPGIDPDYICASRDPGVVRVISISGGQVIIEAIYPGVASLTIRDTINDFETTVDVTVAAIVPDVSGLPVEEAVAAIEAAGLIVGIATDEYNLDVEAGSVISTSPGAGSAVAAGGLVDMAVSLGEDPNADLILLPGGVPLEMVWIPAGSFQMGRYPDEQDSYQSWEDPQHWVTVPGFWMGKYEVTQAQWQALMGSNPSRFPGANRPVEMVSWNTITETFLPALNEATGQTFRLPSEAEWEYACRAGTTTRFYWGDDPDYTQIDSYAWCGGNSYIGLRIRDVGGKAPNAFGLHDMSGNVWEWCEDDMQGGDYTGAPTDGSAWLLSPRFPLRVTRGGGGLSGGSNCRSAARSGYGPSDADIDIGFRLAR
jgi:formylglycine-generating enzyme required for sulfatase activity